MRFVLDAGVALVWFLRDDDPGIVDYADAVLEAVERGDAEAVVPWIWHLELAAVLLRRHRARALSRDSLDEALKFLEALELETHPQPHSAGAIVERAQRQGLQAADALYLDLARELELPIATVDRGLRSAAKAHGVALVAPAAG